MTHAFIISFNRLTALQNLCSELVKRKCKPIIVDNGSTYKPLLKWLSTCEYTVHRLRGEADHLSPWKFGFVRHHAAGKPYIVTDNDLDISGVPLDMVEYLQAGFEVENVTKVGLSLEILDLPYNDYTKEVVDWEKKFWQTQIGGYFRAPIDTTLALYNSITPLTNFYPALRADRPYTARHLPWYNVPPLSEEEQYLMDNTNHHGYWKTKYLEHFGK